MTHGLSFEQLEELVTTLSADARKARTDAAASADKVGLSNRDKANRQLGMAEGLRAALAHLHAALQRARSS
jgi:hypothetical protein